MEELIVKQTAAKDKDFYPSAKDVGKTIQVDGDLGSNTIPFYLINKDGTDGPAATDDLGGAVELSATNVNMLVTGTYWVRIKKGTTSNAVGINLV